MRSSPVFRNIPALLLLLLLPLAHAFTAGSYQNLNELESYDLEGLVVDHDDNLYVAVPENGQVYFTPSSTGVTVVYAGSDGLPDPSDINFDVELNGDFGPAANATLSYPCGLALAENGTVLYIADAGSNNIRRVDDNQTISTFAGNFTGSAGTYSNATLEATLVGLNGPQGVATDHEGNVYISDTDNCVIRKVDMDGMMSVIAGTGYMGDMPCNYSADGYPATSVGVGSPYGIAVDREGNVYFADFDNHVVRRISNETVTTIAGKYGNASYTGDGSAANASTLISPLDVVLDHHGSLFIADAGSCTVREISLITGIISTVVGTGNCMQGTDEGVNPTSDDLGPVDGLAFSPNGTSLYLSDGPQGAIYEVTDGGMPLMGMNQSGNSNMTHNSTSHNNSTNSGTRLRQIVPPTKLVTRSNVTINSTVNGTTPIVHRVVKIRGHFTLSSELTVSGTRPLGMPVKMPNVCVAWYFQAAW